ncbi:ribosomal protein S2 [Saccharata proteae CBS 121410]|uniref:Ribosomal protein S2 n=1 Tax=Saccharata proteae CBS 121410 TaxID=1314787 RepID=A0A9P4LUT9_9PEZI|nr:ribosomal protein S2 [Saccharata proteae CBS 121410]
MILRRFAARQVRSAVFAPSHVRIARRSLATEVDLLERTQGNQEKETRSIAAQVNTLSPEAVPTPSSQTPTTIEGEVAEDYAVLKQHERQLANLGSVVEPHYHPRDLVNNPPSPSDVSLELLLASQAHLGHSASVWNPANARYIFGVRQGIHIISLDVTAAHLRRAAKVVKEVARKGGLILFVGTRKGQDRCIIKAAKLAKGCHLFERWKPGGITNGMQILGRCEMKVVDQFDREVPGFEPQLKERPVLKPDLVVCLNPLENYVLLHECATNLIPTIGIIDTDANPTWVTYPIPANDDSLRCTQVIAGVLGRAGEEGQKQRLEAAARGDTTYEFETGLRVTELEEVKAEE